MKYHLIQIWEEIGSLPKYANFGTESMSSKHRSFLCNSGRNAGSFGKADQNVNYEDLFTESIMHKVLNNKVLTNLFKMYCHSRRTYKMQMKAFNAKNKGAPSRKVRQFDLLVPLVNWEQLKTNAEYAKSICFPIFSDNTRDDLELFVQGGASLITLQKAITSNQSCSSNVTVSNFLDTLQDLMQAKHKALTILTQYK
mgnify:CR=1 FL=1